MTPHNTSNMTPERWRRTLFYWDGLRYSFAMANIALRRLRETLDSLARRQETSDQSEDEVSAALLDAWAIVDMCHRVRELVQQTPGLPRNLPQVQLFLRATSDVKNLRDYVQHFRSGIPKIPVPSTPVWGALSWAPDHQETTWHTIVTGNPAPGVNVPTCSYDTHWHCFPSRLMLFVGEIPIDLNSIGDRLTSLRTSLLGWIDQTAPFKRIEGKTPILHFTVQIQVKAADSPPNGTQPVPSETNRT